MSVRAYDIAGLRFRLGSKRGVRAFEGFRADEAQEQTHGGWDIEVVDAGSPSRGPAPAIARDGHALRYEARGTRATFDLAASRGRIEGAVDGRGIIGAFRALLGVVLPRQGGLLLHGAAVCRAHPASHEPMGTLFLGASGAGKSTIARLAAETGARVLGDEVVAVRLAAEGRVRLFGTPLGSRAGGPSDARSCRLQTIAWLSHAAEHSFAPAPRADAVRQLIARSIAPPEAVDGEVLLESAAHIAACVRAGELRFRPTNDFWSAWSP